MTRMRLSPILILLSAFIALGAVYAVATPLFEVSDEVWHYPMVKRLADGYGLPVQDPANPGPWRQEGSQPPLYYGLMALATAWIDTGDMEQVRWLNPHVDNGIITADGNNNILVHTSREGWPWRGTVLAVRLIRLLSVLLAAGTVYFTYRLALELAPGETALALASAGFAALTPMFLFVSASVNNDTLAITLSTAALWLLVRWVRGPLPPLGWPHAVLGALLGGAALSKVSALGLMPLAGLVLLFGHVQSYRANPDLPRILRSLILQGLVVFGVALVVCGWWFVRNWQLYGDWLGWSAFLDTVGRRSNPATLAQLWGERAGFVQAYWGLFGGVNVPMPGWTYASLNAMMAVAALGAAWGAVRAFARRRVMPADLAAWALPLAWIVLLLIGLIRWTSLTWASQGRLMFPGIAAISVIAVLGLAQFGRRLPWIALGGLAALSAAVPFGVIAPHYAPPPELTAAQLAALPQRAEADFGGEMKLLGHSLETDSVLPGGALKLTLYWQSQIAMDRDWSVFVHLVDEAGVIVAQRDRFPGRGALATTLLRPGQTLADEFVIPIPAVAYSPVAAQIRVGLYDANTGERLPVTGGGDSFSLAPVQIRARSTEIPNLLGQNFAGRIELVGYEMTPRRLRPGETLQLTLYWRGLAEMDTNYSVFAHVRGEGDSMWAGVDSWPRQGAAPTSTWRVGDLLADTYSLTLRPDTPPRLFDVEVGLYDSATLERLQLVTADGRPEDADLLFLGKIRVDE